MTYKSRMQNTLLALIFVCLTASASAQTTAFNYQGRLTDTGTPQSSYQMRFELYDALIGGTQIGATVTNPAVAVALGSFSIQLDFGAAAFDGTDRFLEIAVRKTSNDNWTVLNARQPIGSTPYSIKSMTSTTADSLSAACVGCVQDANIATISGSKVIGQIPSQSVPTGSGNYIQNAATALRSGQNPVQDAADFNIDGSGVIGDSLGIGIVPRAGIKLDVIGTAIFSPVGAGFMQFGNPNSETGMTTIVGNGRTDLRFDGTTLKLVAGLVGGPPSSTNGIVINTLGKVTIGNVSSTQVYGNLTVGGNGFDTAVVGDSVDGYGIFGKSANFIGVYGESNCPGCYGVYGANSSGGFAGYFNGLTHVGRLEVGGLGTAGTTPVCYNTLKLLASCSSSLRYKKDLQPFSDGLSFIYQLRPIAYKWKADDQPDIGFGAEDVAKIDPRFVTFNDKGEVEGVKYDRLSVVFVNAFKVQQSQIGEQQKQLEQQRIEIENLKKLICLDHPNADICQAK